MRTSLSASADPDCRIVDLLDACRRRGLQGIELVSDAECDLPRALDPADLAELGRLLSRHDCPVAGLYIHDLHEICTLETAQLAARVAAPIVAPAGVVPSGLLRDLDALYASARGRILVSHRSHVEEASTLLGIIKRDRLEHVGVAWEVRPALDDLRGARSLVESLGGRLEYVRLSGGGGPEQSAVDGRGLGSLVMELARLRYSGPFVLAPSERGKRPLWKKWMESSKPGGCGTAGAAHERRRRRNDRRHLDVRDVEPKDRIQHVLGAYSALPLGVPLELTLDHDPRCMYYTLEATDPGGDFSFDYLEQGPTVWRVQVTKR